MGAAEHRSDGGVLSYGHGTERPDDLEGAADAKPRHPVWRLARDRAALPADVATVQPVHPADAVEQRRLARAVGADDPDDLALPHLELDAIDRRYSPKPLGHVQQLQLRRGCAQSEVSRSDRRRYARLRWLRPPKKAITPRGTKITTPTRSRPRMICATTGRAVSETNGRSNESGRVPPRNWIRSWRRIAPAAGPNTVPVPPSSAIRIIWTLYSIGNALSWLMKTFHWEKIPPARPVSAAASAKAATL